MYTPSRKIGAGLTTAVLTLGGAALVVNATSAQAATPARGHGISIEGGRDYVGYYINAGHKGYCIDPSKTLSREQSWGTITNLPGVSYIKSKELEEILFAHGNTNSNYEAASVSQALNYVKGNKADFTRRSHYLPKSVNARASVLVHEVEKLRGGAVLSIRVTTAVLVGQTGTIGIKLVSGSGYGLAGKKVALAASNATIARVITLSKYGTGYAHFNRTGSGTVGFVGKASGLVPTTMLLSHAGAGQQRLLSFTPSTSVSASAHYQKYPALGTTKYACTTICNGKPPVSTTFCHAAREATRKYNVYDNGRLVKTITIAQSSSNVCDTVTVVIPDTHTASFKCNYYVGGKWSALVVCGKPVVVDCPEWPVVTEKLTSSCTTGSIELSLPKNVSKHNMEITYSVNGGSNITKIEKSGTTLVVLIPFDRSKSTTDVVFTGSVQRSNGAWNGGGAEEVIVRQIA